MPVLAQPRATPRMTAMLRGHVETESPAGGGDGAGEQTLAPEVAPALDRIGAGSVVLARPASDRLAGHLLGALENVLLHRLGHRCAPGEVSVPQIPRGRNRTNAMKITPITMGQASMKRLSRSARIRNVAAPTKGPKKGAAPPSKVMITTWPEVVQ